MQMSTAARMLVLVLFFSQNLSATLTAQSKNATTEVILKEIDSPILIEEARENIQCEFFEGTPGTFQPFNTLVLSFEKKSPFPFALRNSPRLAAYGYEASLTLTDGTDGLAVRAEDCNILMRQIQQMISSDNQLLLPGKRRFLIAYKHRILEEHFTEFLLGPLHNENTGSILVRLSSSVYLDFNKGLPTQLSDFGNLEGKRKGSARIHPQAASEIGLNCVDNPDFLDPENFTFSLGLYPKDAISLTQTTLSGMNSMSKENCELRRQQVIETAQVLDPNNLGELVDVKENTQWIESSLTLKMDILFAYQKLMFRNAVHIIFR